LVVAAYIHEISDRHRAGAKAEEPPSKHSNDD
jgi:hypothetical protein